MDLYPLHTMRDKVECNSTVLSGYGSIGRKDIGLKQLPIHGGQV